MGNEATMLLCAGFIIFFCYNEKEGLELGDQTTKLFLNSKGHSESLDSDVAAFLRYVDGKAPQGEFIKEVDQEVVRLKKHDETRREYMTLAMELRKFKAERYRRRQ